MRDRIKGLATELLIRHGYHGVSFGDIARTLDTTRANVHYHFGNKLSLVEELLDDYLQETLTAFRAIWTDGSTTFFGKIEATVEYNRRRFLKFNPGNDTRLPWSLISRMRLDADMLSDKGRNALQGFADELHTYVISGIRSAKARGELAASAPVEDIALQMVAIVNSAGPITQDAGNFDRLEQLYLAVGRVVIHAYGKRGAGAASGAAGLAPVAAPPVPVAPAGTPAAARARSMATEL